MRGPYITVRKKNMVEFTITIGEGLYDLMMKQVKEEKEPNRAKWVREAIAQRLNITDGEFP